MLPVAIALVTGFLATRLAWGLLRHTLSAPIFERANYRGHKLPTAGGLAIAAATFAVEGGRVIVGAAGIGDASVVTVPRLLTLFAVAGFTLVGLADDLGAVGDARGFGGHVRSLIQGRLTTGGLKLLGGGLIAVLIAGPAGRLGGQEPGVRALGWLAVDAAVIALSANLGNLFDRAPGRTIKFSTVAFALVLIAAALNDQITLLAGPSVAVGAALGLLYDDLREHCMLGDTGANALGAVVGLAVVLDSGRVTRVAVLVGLLLLNLVSETMSFSRVIDRVGVLRAFDRAGALPYRRSNDRQ